MLAAIDFDNQHLLVADEVGDETPDRNLPTKLQSVEASIPQFRPHAQLGVGRVLAHSAREAPEPFIDWPAHTQSFRFARARYRSVVVRVSPSPGLPNLAIAR